MIAISWTLMPGPAAATEGGVAYSIAVARVIDPSASRFLERAIDDARRRKAAVLIVRLDTPGGSEYSMRAMARAIAAAPMPVIVYVHPSGARADSAGVILTLAADVAAMAPQTNIGSATPVAIAPPARDKIEQRFLRDLRRKAINAGAAFARALAEDHGRNADLAERMVRKAENVSATQARRKGLIDVVAPTEQALLRSLNGFTVKGRKAQRLQTSDLELKRFDDAAIHITDVDDFDNSSWWRSLAYVIGAPAIIALGLLGFGRARPKWRRWRRKRRRLRRQQRRSTTPYGHGPG